MRALVCLALAPAGAFLAPRPWASNSRRAGSMTRCSAGGSIGSFTVPAFTREQAQTLASQNWVCVPNFVPSNAVASLRADVMALRSESKFKVGGRASFAFHFDPRGLCAKDTPRCHPMAFDRSQASPSF
jgi:hypothetical protein